MRQHNEGPIVGQLVFKYKKLDKKNRGKEKSKRR